MAGIKIIGLGRSHGAKKVTNSHMEKLVDTSDQWIREKTGIKSRYFAGEKSNEDMAVEAAIMAMEDGKVKAEDIDMCIVCTFTPDNLSPAVACGVAGRLGLRENILSFDLNGACAGFIFGCNLADGILGRNGGGYALIIGSEKISPVMDMEDRSTCVLFGDGAGAAILKWDEAAAFNIHSGCCPNEEVLNCGRGKEKIQMCGQEVYRFAVNKVPQAIKAVMEKGGYEEKDVDWFVCHQANERIIDGAAKKFASSKEKFFKNLHEYGNTSAASIPIALREMKEEGLLMEGSRLVCTGFGAGLTYASMIITTGENDD